MGLFIAVGLVLLYWIVDKIEAHQGEKDYKAYQEELRKARLIK